MWPRVDGLRALELGSPGEVRDRLNALVLAGQKQATAGVADEYVEQDEVREHPGERLALLDSAGAKCGVVEVTALQEHRFDDVPWEFAQAEGEGDTSIEQWRQGHRHYWLEVEGRTITPDTPIVCIYFRLVDPAAPMP